MSFRVFKQMPPIDTGEQIQKPSYGTWHRANLKELGVVETWEEAKRLTPIPVVEHVTKH